MSAATRHRDAVLSKSLSGQQSAKRRPGAAGVLFRPITLISLLLIGLFAFGALIVLSGFAKDLRKAPPGQATTRSISAVGYQALSEYLTELNFDVAETRGERGYYDRESRLVVYTPSSPYTRLKRTLEDTEDEVRLIVLPKWSVGQMIPQKGESGRNDWARKTSEEGLHSAGDYQSMMEDMPVIRRHSEPTVNAQVFFDVPNERSLPPKLSPDFKDLQYFDLNTAWTDYQSELRALREAEAEARRRKNAAAEGKEYTPKEAKEAPDTEDVSETENVDPFTLPEHDSLMKIDGKTVLIRLENTQTYILSEPDLINTMAFETQSGAHLASAIINEVIGEAGLEWQVIDFDVSLHGIEANRNIIKLMVTPPFLAATLCLLAAGGLVAWQGFNRFGDPARVQPDYAQGPVSLAKTAAGFMETAGRAHKTGDAYADLIRRQVAEALGFGARSMEHTNTLVDAREKRLELQPRFADLKHAIKTADMQSYPQYARALTAWRDAMTATNMTISDQKNIDLGQEDRSL
jgi:hypothetical protein